MSVEEFVSTVSRPGWTLDTPCLQIGDVDPAVWLAELDAIAAGCVADDAAGLVAELFGLGRWTGNSIDYYSEDNCYLHRVLERRLGMPIMLSILAIEVGRRVGIVLKGIALPSHFVIADETMSYFYDPFHLGRQLSAVDCRLLVRAMTGSDTWRDSWLIPASNEEIVLRVLQNLKGIAQRSRDYALLQRVMRMRMAFPSVAEAESRELRRIMAPFN